MLFILAEKEEYFNNKDHGIKAFERAKGPKKLVTIPGNHTLRHLRGSPAAGPEAGHRVVRRTSQALIPVDCWFNPRHVDAAADDEIVVIQPNCKTCPAGRVRGRSRR